MKVTLSWIKQYVDFDWSPEELQERLTMIGIEVEGVQNVAGEFEGVLVAEIVASEKHPNADKLSVCRVNDGQGIRQIVCGAKNYKVGDKVALALPGATLPASADGALPTIKVGKIRGIESEGMMCSPRELQLAEDAEGLMILDPMARVGQPFAEHLGRSGGDVVYDLEITPNRPDLNSVIGIAREISALNRNPLRWPALDQAVPRDPRGLRASDIVSVRIEEPELCPRYVARVIRGVKIGASPNWLKSLLEKLGLRSINNVVDATNYVMYESGQPLHAFDYRLLSSSDPPSTRPTIVIRRAHIGERLVTLDGQKHTLADHMLVIADETKPIALAGVMGGLNSEVNQQTVDLLLESAYFKPQNIRATSKQLDLRTDASYRFERGGDIEIVDWASRRAAQLIRQTAGGQLLPEPVEAYPQPFAPREIAIRHAKVDQLLGIEIPLDQQRDFLVRLGLNIVSHVGLQIDSSSGGGASAIPQDVQTTFRIPSFRVDLKREVDLIEEITRLHGVDRIPAAPPRGARDQDDFDPIYDQLAEARRLLIGFGLHEAQGQTFISDPSARLSGIEPVALQNPLSSDMNMLRPSLLLGLLDALRHNLNHKNHDVALFEIGRVFSSDQGRVREERRLAVALTGVRFPSVWSGSERNAKFDLYDLKGMLEEFLEQFGVRGVTYSGRSEVRPLFLESAALQLGKQIIGELGLLRPNLSKQYDLRDPVLLAELNFDLLLARRIPARTFKPLSAFPAIRRDVAMIVSESITHDSVLQAIKQAKPANLEAVDIFDVFRGKNVPADQKSIAYALTYRHPERTLTDSEVNAIHEKLVEQLKKTLPAIIRE